jgi:hypothetical protein
MLFDDEAASFYGMQWNKDIVYSATRWNDSGSVDIPQIKPVQFNQDGFGFMLIQ